MMLDRRRAGGRRNLCRALRDRRMIERRGLVIFKSRPGIRDRTRNIIRPFGLIALGKPRAQEQPCNLVVVGRVKTEKLN